MIRDTIIGINATAIVALAIALARTRERVARLEGKVNNTKDKPMD